MRKFCVGFLIALGVGLFVVAVMPHRAQAVPARQEMRGLWLTTAYNLDFPSRQGLSAADLRREIDEVLTRSAAQGINAIFFQVRPTADSFFPSQIFPWSHLISGTQGVAAPGGFDPLAYILERGHALGIEIHAWINPFRVTFPNQRITNPAQLAAGHPARENPDWVIAYNNALFFDPGNPAARAIIIEGIREMLQNYNLDGIHLDDYFYPSRSFPDAATFARYGGDAYLHDWRRENVNALVREIQAAVRQVRPTARFGISPFAIWQNDNNHPQGSATRGTQSYHAMYADTRRWVQEGWLDYIAPQIYWPAGFEIADYAVLLPWWEDVVRGTGVDLYIGLAVYREVLGRAGWDGEILRQLQRNAASDVVAGSIFFRAAHMNSAVGDAIGEFFGARGVANISPPPPPPPTLTPSSPPPPPTPPPPPPPPVPRPPTVEMESLTVVQPAGNTDANAAGYYFFGSGRPGVPIYVNGAEVTNRTDEGFFSVFMPLVQGVNTFVFSQAGSANITRAISNNVPAPPQPPPTMGSYQVLNPTPAADEWVSAGVTITLQATAPAGSVVSVQLAGHTIPLVQQTNLNYTATPGNLISAAFSAEFVIPAAAADAAVLGRPVYTAQLGANTATATAAGTFHQYAADAALYAQVTADAAWVFSSPATAGGSAWRLYTGQIARVAGISGSWVRLGVGGWVQQADVRIWHEPDFALAGGDAVQLGFLSEGLYIPGAHYDTILWLAPFNQAIGAWFDGDVLTVTLGAQDVAPPVFYGSSATLFEDIQRTTHEGAGAYLMRLRPDARLEGFAIVYDGGQIRLILRHRRQLAVGDMPFDGFSFVLDAGHGGTDPGAIGPMGRSMSEANLVLAQTNLLAARLRMLGANVVLTRSTDETLSLQDRVEISHEAMPDMFISLHTNATAATTDATNIHGFTVWYKNPNSRTAAQHFMNSMRYTNPLTNRHPAPSHANFFVLRGAWSPAILLEASFTNNIQDFSWMLCPVGRDDYVWGIINALLGYYRVY